MLVKKKGKPVFMDAAIGDLILHEDVQMRAALNRSAIADYADEMEAGTKFPPVHVFWTPGQPKIVADGMHRVLARRKLAKQYPKAAEWKTIRAQIHQGGKRDAMLFAAGANRTHGIRRTCEDKRKTVLAFLGDSKWREWTDSEIARHAGVSGPMVGRYRKWLGEGAAAGRNGFGDEVRTYVDRVGRERTRTVTHSPEDASDKLEKRIKGELCPYCGQRMPGNQHKIRN
jgi:hypothetical protein